jgi:hypothetical protein
MLAGQWTAPTSSTCRRWLQKLSSKVQELNANLVAMCMPYVDAYHTRSATRKAGASV